MCSFSRSQMPCISSSGVSTEAASRSASCMMVCVFEACVADMLLFKHRVPNAPDALRLSKELKVNRVCQRLQPINERGAGRVQELVVDAVHATVARCRRLRPPALLHDLLQRDAIARTAPGGNDHVWCRCSNLFGGDLLSRNA